MQKISNLFLAILKAWLPQQKTKSAQVVRNEIRKFILSLLLLFHFVCVLPKTILKNLCSVALEYLGILTYNDQLFSWPRALGYYTAYVPVKGST